MASANHDFIVAAVVRKMRLDGFEIVYLDGRHSNVTVSKFYVPPKIISHRPDAIGRKGQNTFCIGEAKTKEDLVTGRTRNQIRDFLSVVCVDSGNKLYLGIPLSAKATLEKLLSTLQLESSKLIDIICVPDSLLPSNEEI